MSIETQLIRLDAISKAYGEQKVLDQCSITINGGEFVSIVGRSGSGKSTLLKIIGALGTPDSGSIHHGADDLTAMNEQERTLFRRRKLGFVFQFFNLVPTLTASENVALPLALNGQTTAQAEQRVRELLETLGVSACAARLPDELSGGEQQRVAIARAIAHQPSLVITDEPTGNLDTETADEVLQLLIENCRHHGTTLIMATHSREAAAAADRCLRIIDGKLVADR